MSVPRAVSWTITSDARTHDRRGRGYERSETWIIRGGSARFTVDGREMEAGAGDILVVQAETPHKFKNVGPGSLDIACIHPSPRFIQEDLE
ncbi:MAG: cupin domain-containing protein [Actinobacteria bacterium]|nr:cupin domain-containing protein [Actinomycetota bacterium]